MPLPRYWVEILAIRTRFLQIAESKDRSACSCDEFLAAHSVHRMENLIDLWLALPSDWKMKNHIFSILSKLMTSTLLFIVQILIYRLVSFRAVLALLVP